MAGSSDHGPARRGGLPRWLVAAVAFVLGGLAGGTLVAVTGLELGGGAEQVREGREPEAAPGSTPVECAEMADVSVRTVELAQRAAGAIGTFQARELAEVADELEELDPRVRALADACRRAAETTVDTAEEAVGDPGTEPGGGTG